MKYGDVYRMTLSNGLPLTVMLVCGEPETISRTDAWKVVVLDPDPAPAFGRWGRLDRLNMYRGGGGWIEVRE